MVNAGASRDRLAGILGAAFADGLLSEHTFTHRLGLLFGQRLVDPDGVVGDLSARGRDRQWVWPPVLAAVFAACRWFVEWPAADGVPSLVLALDWVRGDEELVIGRDDVCDIPLADAGVSRRHARLHFRDGAWIVEDLGSLNGTAVNGVRVGRCRLRPGDHLRLGGQVIEID
jgi:hypothetical protein